MSFCKKEEIEQPRETASTSTYNYESDVVTDDYFDDCIGCGCRENFEDTGNNRNHDFSLPIEPSRVPFRDVGIGIQPECKVNYNHSPQLSVSAIAAAEVRAKIKEFRERAELASMDDSRISVSNDIHWRNSRCCYDQTIAEQPPKLERTCGEKTQATRYRVPDRKRSTSPQLVMLTYGNEMLRYEQNAQLRPCFNRTPKRQADPRTSLDGRND